MHPVAPTAPTAPMHPERFTLGCRDSHYVFDFTNDCIYDVFMMQQKLNYSTSLMQKYSKDEIEWIRHFLQRRDDLYKEKLIMSFQWIVNQLLKEFDIKISRSTLCRYSRKIDIGQARSKVLQQKPKQKPKPKIVKVVKVVKVVKSDDEESGEEIEEEQSDE
ncbi:Hypothetical_protein [Hexamita inflata]|uniref:Hypothetical_protein n=1 Tax=Hexamita inflata TaxID=28002 RepID=A0AA86NCK3_9EUKA|nr:Hypothetical protein HINF_LOCUS4615 [Hexamita inflata]CAI9945725.1 Hypothetical protein HINF_LOCUS33370 [Hexamita inflata]